MEIVLYIAGGLVGLVVLMAAIGLVLPRDHVAARSVQLAKAPAVVWKALTQLEAQAKWRRGIKKVERTSLTQFRETSASGTITYEVVEERANELRITRIADNKLAFGGRWIYELAPADGGTRLSITEDGFIKNPIFRFLSKTVFSTTATVENFLDDLAAHLGTRATIERTEPSQHARRASVG